MIAYYFSKLNEDSLPAHFFKYAGSEVIVCFDLEDGIGEIFSEEKTFEKKNLQRKLIYDFFNKFSEELIDVRFGIRINTNNQHQLLSDIDLLSDLKIRFSLFIPKTDSQENFINILNLIDSKKIKTNEIIPVIESKSGIKNLEWIVTSDERIKSVAFGHCDYNFSENIFPFFHQDTLEYWKWANKIIEIISPRKIKFIDSPYLKMSDSIFFGSLLSHLNYLTGGNFGQITLNSLQTKLCLEFNKKPDMSFCIAKNRYNLGTNENEIKSFINTFNTSEKINSFAITKENIYLSPQEYKSACEHLKKIGNHSIKIIFIGGCFPVQQNILYEDIFHSRIKKTAEEKYNVNINFNIVRYQRFKDCPEKLIRFGFNWKSDYVILHIRPEPYLRLVKFYYKYQDKSLRLRRKLNILLFGINAAERFDDLIISKNIVIKAPGKKNIFRRLLINLNYGLGYLIGNSENVATLILKIVQQIQKYCDEKKIRFYTLNPAAMQYNKTEKFLTKRLIKKLIKKFEAAGIKYLNGSDKNMENSPEKYFERDSIYATENYHKYISEIILKEIEYDI